MFETHDTDEIIDEHSEYGDCFRIWRSVDKVGKSPWFHVEYSYGDSQQVDDNLQGEIIFIHEISFLIKFIEIENLTISNIHIVTPSCLNKSNYWKMELIYAIKTGNIENRNNIKAYKFILYDGRVILLTAEGLEINNRIENEVILYTKISNV